MTRIHSVYLSGRAVLFVSFVNQTVALEASGDDGALEEQTDEYVANPNSELVAASSNSEFLIQVYGSSIHVLDLLTKTKFQEFVPSSRILGAVTLNENIYCFDELNYIRCYRVNAMSRLIESEHNIESESAMICLAMFTNALGYELIKLEILHV